MSFLLTITVYQISIAYYLFSLNFSCALWFARAGICFSCISSWGYDTSGNSLSYTNSSQKDQFISIKQKLNTMYNK